MSYLYVFLDEGGDLNFSNTGTKFFTLTTVTKTRPFPWDNDLISLKYDYIEFGLDIEYFHASEDRQVVRDRVFESIVNNLPAIRLDSLIVEKRKTATGLQDVERFYPKMVGHLLTYVLHPINIRRFSEIVVITDNIPVKKKRSAIEKAIKQTLSSKLPPGTKYRVLHHASKSCPSLQVADYCNWAIFKKWERGDIRSYDLIRQGVKSEFDIFKAGSSYYY